MAGSDVIAHNWAQGTTAAIVGPARARIRQVIIYADAAGAFTFKDGGSGGSTILTQTFPTGLHSIWIAGDGVLATDGVYVSAFTGSSNELTIFLS
jgi:hypothetical protein|tara:strand:- start:24 stop:308 length:285 start_codon:yes stop_codon:yes gene_type:complete